MATKRSPTKTKLNDMTKAQLLKLVAAQRRTIIAMSRSLRITALETTAVALAVTETNTATTEMLELVKKHAPVERRSAYGNMKDIT